MIYGKCYMERKRDWQISLAAPVISALGMSENGTAITAVCTHSLDVNRCRFFSQLRFRNCSSSFCIIIHLRHILSGVSYIRAAEQLPLS